MSVREGGRERGRGRERGTENEQKRGGANVERGNWEERGKQPKQVKGAEVVWHCLIPLLQATPPPLQFPRLFRHGPVSAIRVTAEATMAATVGRSDNNNKKHLRLWSKEWSFSTSF